MSKKKILSGLLAAATVLGANAASTLSCLGTVAMADVAEAPSTKYYDKLSTQQKKYYNTVLAAAKKIVNGETTSTTVEFSGLVTSGSDEELDALVEGIDAAAVACRRDHPELWFWFMKGTSYNYKGGVFTASFEVDIPYRNGGEYTVSAAAMQKGADALNAAQAIASKYSSLPAYERVFKFAEEVAALNKYNSAAAGNVNSDSLADMGPWNLVYIFDGDTSTNTVCEGYAKAFKYLCDLSGIDCCLVTGNAGTSSSSGPHMWNIVILDGKPYHVDVTFADTTTNDNIDLLTAVHPYILKGVESSSATKVVTKEFTYSSSIFTSSTYKYDTKELALLSDSILTVSTSDYEYKEDENTSDDSSSDTSTEDTSTSDTSTEDTSTSDTSTEDTSTSDTSTEDTSTSDTSTEDTSTSDTSTGDTSTSDTSTGDTSTSDTSTGDTSTSDTSTGDTSTSTGGSTTGSTDTGSTGSTGGSTGSGDTTAPADTAAGTSLEDSGTGIKLDADKGVVPEGTKLSTETVPSDDEDQETFDITLTKDGEAVQPDGAVTVKIPVPEKFKAIAKLYVYRVENGKYILIPSSIESGFVVFKTDHFSTYVVSSKALGGAEKPAVDTGVPGLAAILGTALIAGTVAVVAKKKK